MLPWAVSIFIRTFCRVLFWDDDLSLNVRIRVEEVGQGWTRDEGTPCAERHNLQTSQQALFVVVSLFFFHLFLLGPFYSSKPRSPPPPVRPPTLVKFAALASLCNTVLRQGNCTLHPRPFLSLGVTGLICVLNACSFTWLLINFSAACLERTCLTQNPEYQEISGATKEKR